MNARAALVLGVLLAACSAGSGAPQSPPQTVRRDAAGFPAPDRPVSDIVAPTWTADADRDAVREFQQVAAAGGIRAGMTVADIGAGTGYYVVRASPMVGPTGRVFAEDIIPEYLTLLRIAVRGLANVTVVEGDVADPHLPPASVDVALMIHMYHEIEQPYALLHHLAASMKPGGKLVIVDMDYRPPQHGTPRDLLRCELAAVGYRQLSIKTLDNDPAYVAVFAAPAANALPRPQAITPCKMAG